MTDFYAQLERQLVEAGRRRTGRGRWRIALAGRARPLLAVAAVVLVGVALAASISLLGSGAPSSEPGGTGHGDSPPAAPGANWPTVTATVPTEQTQLPRRPLRGTLVAVYNGTTTTGAARAIAERLEAQGATIGSVGTAADQGQTRTVVGHGPGAGTQARLVATILGLRDMHRMTHAETAMSRGADVIVQVGADLARP